MGNFVIQVMNSITHASCNFDLIILLFFREGKKGSTYVVLQSGPWENVVAVFDIPFLT